MQHFYRLCAAMLCTLAGQACLAGELPMPAPQTQGAVSFVTGGIGLDEANAFRAAAAQYNLRITLAAETGEFFAGVKVTLLDAQGRTVAEATSDGPYVFFKVPPGKYQVVADNLGQSVRKTVHARAHGGAELVLRWKAPLEQ